MSENTSWVTKEMLIFCQTHPALSSQYTETVCTGAVEVGTGRLMRLYPIALRALTNGAEHRKWNVIRANVMQNPARDKRPESWRIDNDSIRVLGDRIPVGDDRRIVDLLRDENKYSGLEHVQFEQKRVGTSIALVKPNFVGASLERISEAEQRRWSAKSKEIQTSTDLWHKTIKPISAPRVKPKLTFRCDEDSKDYERTLMGWEFYELARKTVERYPDLEEASRVFGETVQTRCFSSKHDTWLALGNIHRFADQFSIIALLYPKFKEPEPEVEQGALFG